MSDMNETYDIAFAPAMIDKIERENLDMVVGSRIPVNPDRAFRSDHFFFLMRRLAYFSTR
jgi:hypothetical protein